MQTSSFSKIAARYTKLIVSFVKYGIQYLLERPKVEVECVQLRYMQGNYLGTEIRRAASAHEHKSVEDHN